MADGGEDPALRPMSSYRTRCSLALATLVGALVGAVVGGLGSGGARLLFGIGAGAIVGALFEQWFHLRRIRARVFHLLTRSRRARCIAAAAGEGRSVAAPVAAGAREDADREVDDLRAALEAERQRRADRDALVHQVAHELKTPLTAARDLLAILEEQIVGPLNAEQADVAESARGSIEMMRHLVDDLLDRARLDTGKLRLQIGEHPVRELVECAVQQVRLLPIARDVHVVAYVRNNVPLMRFDSTRIMQVLINLMTNAMKALDHGGRVTVFVACENRLLPDGRTSVLFVVNDSGRGLDSRAIPRLFGRGEQLTEADATERGGLGVGLGLCREIVELHGGMIYGSSRPGDGATFGFRLPVAGPATAEPTAEPYCEIEGANTGAEESPTILPARPSAIPEQRARGARAAMRVLH